MVLPRYDEIRTNHRRLVTHVFRFQSTRIWVKVFQVACANATYDWASRALFPPRFTFYLSPFTFHLSSLTQLPLAWWRRQGLAKGFSQEQASILYRDRANRVSNLLPPLQNQQHTKQCKSSSPEFCLFTRCFANSGKPSRENRLCCNVTREPWAAFL